jgi:hypothetical protein
MFRITMSFEAFAWKVDLAMVNKSRIACRFMTKLCSVMIAAGRGRQCTCVEVVEHSHLPRFIFRSTMSFETFQWQVDLALTNKSRIACLSLTKLCSVTIAAGRGGRAPVSKSSSILTFPDLCFRLLCHSRHSYDKWV